MSGEKPAPTAAEIAEAQEMLNLYAHIIDPPIAGQWVRTLLAALDAAEARATEAEKERDDAEVFAQGSVRMVRERLATAERERDEARAALKPFAECWNNFKAAPVDDKRHPRIDPIACAFEPWRRAAEVMKEAPRG